jgi:acid stress chaperone HdeB
MSRFVLVVSMLVSAAATLATAQAQVTLDVSKITCDQFTGYRITDPKNIAIWLSGYHSGKRGSTVIETKELEANARKLQDYCIRNPQIQVMQAVETLLSPAR